MPNMTATLIVFCAALIGSICSVVAVVFKRLTLVWSVVILTGILVALLVTAASAGHDDMGFGPIGGIPMGTHGYTSCFALQRDASGSLWIAGNFPLWSDPSRVTSLAVTRVVDGVRVRLTEDGTRVYPNPVCCVPSEGSLSTHVEWLPVLDVDESDVCHTDIS